MNKIFIKKALWGFAAICLLALVSCKNSASPAGTSVHDGPFLRIRASSASQPALQANQTGLPSERTIQTSGDVTSFTDFVFYGMNVEDDDYQTLGNYNDYTELTNASINLDKSEVSEVWSFKLTAMNGEIQYSGSTVVTIDDGENNIFIVLKDEATGEGSFTVTVDYSAVANAGVGSSIELADKALIELYGDDDYYTEYTQTGLSSNTEHKFICQMDNLNTGSYLLHVYIRTAEGANLASWSEAVNVNPHERTVGTINIRFFDLLYDVVYEFEGKGSGDVSFTPMTMVSPSTGIDELKIPTRKGYIFNGWYTDQECNNLLDSLESLTSSTTLYGNWLSASVSIDDVAATIAAIHGKYEDNPAELKITDTLDSDDIETIREALRHNDETCFIIDLSETGLTVLDEDSFEYCDNLVGVVLPDTLTEIGAYAFDGCKILKSIVIPDNVTTIEEDAFYECYGLESLTIGTGFDGENLGYIFADSYKLKEVIIAEGNSKYIKADDGAIYSTDGATLYWYPPYLGNEVVIADTVETIAAYAFCNNDLSSIAIGEKVSSIGENSFRDCDDLETITVADGNEHYKAEDNVLLTKDGKKIVLYPADKIGESYTIPETVTFIPVGVFSENDYLESIEFVYDGFVWRYSDDYDAGTITEDYILNHWTVLSFDADFLSNCDWSEGESYNQYYFVKTSERNWTESVIKLPAGTNGTAGTSATYVYFGDWPQTIKADDVNVDTTDSIIRGGYTYYKGSDGYWYVKCKEDAWTGGNRYYSNGSLVNVASDSNPSYKYFKVEPIKWCVLTEDYDGDGNALLLAESILNANIVYGVGQTIGGNKINVSNYQYSSIRAYLNGSYKDDDTQTKTYDGTGFLQTAFTDTAQGNIVVTDVDNSSASTNNYSGSFTPASTEYTCANTEDKIFLLSVYEASNPNYGLALADLDKRIKKPTDFALANYAITDSETCAGAWWLRSPGTDYTNERAYRVSLAGGLRGDLYCGGDTNKDIGIVPALTIALN